MQGLVRLHANLASKKASKIKKKRSQKTSGNLDIGDSSSSAENSNMINVSDDDDDVASSVSQNSESKSRLMNKIDQFASLFQQQLDSISRKLESQNSTSQNPPLDHLERCEPLRVIQN